MRSSFLPRPSEVVKDTVPASRSRSPTGDTAVTTAPPAGATYASAAVRSPANASSALSGHVIAMMRGNVLVSGHRRLMKALITGGSGLVGSALTPLLRKQGHEVVSLTRSAVRRPGEYHWDPAKGAIDHAA